MPDIEVTYYTGEWTDAERQAIRATLESSGYAVSEGGGLQRGFDLNVSPQLMLHAEIALGAVTALANLTAAVIALCRALRHKGPDTTIQVFTKQRIYVFPVTEEEAGMAMLADFGDGNADRRGEMRWRDGKWLTFDELYGQAPRSSVTSSRKGRPPQVRGKTRKTRTRKGRRGQTR